MTSSKCSSCGRDCAVGLVHSVRIAGRWVQRRVCVPCELADRKAAR